MQINLNQKLLNVITGKPIEIDTDELSKTEFKEVFVSVEGSQLPTVKKVPLQLKEELTLKTVLLSALTATYRDEEKITAVDKIERYELALEVKKSTKLDLKSEQISKLKELVNKCYSSAVVAGQACLMLEGGKNG